MTKPCACKGCPEECVELVEIEQWSEIWRCDCGHLTSFPLDNSIAPDLAAAREQMTDEQLDRLVMGLSV